MLADHIDCHQCHKRLPAWAVFCRRCGASVGVPRYERRFSATPRGAEVVAPRAGKPARSGSWGYLGLAVAISVLIGILTSAGFFSQRSSSPKSVPTWGGDRGGGGGSSSWTPSPTQTQTRFGTSAAGGSISQVPEVHVQLPQVPDPNAPRPLPGTSHYIDNRGRVVDADGNRVGGTSGIRTYQNSNPNLNPTQYHQSQGSAARSGGR